MSANPDKRLQHGMIYTAIAVVVTIIALIYGWIVGHKARTHEEIALFIAGGLSVLFGLHRVRYSQVRGFPVGGLVLGAFLFGLGYAVVKIF